MNVALQTSIYRWARVQDLSMNDVKVDTPLLPEAIVINDVSAASQRMSRVPAGANGQGGH